MYNNHRHDVFSVIFTRKRGQNKTNPNTLRRPRLPRSKEPVMRRLAGGIGTPAAVNRRIACVCVYSATKAISSPGKSGRKPGGGGGGGQAAAGKNVWRIIPESGSKRRRYSEGGWLKMRGVQTGHTNHQRKYIIIKWDVVSGKRRRGGGGERREAA